MFYALDVSRLKAIYGSDNQALVDEVLSARAEDIQNNDSFFDREDGDGLDSATALREIVSGKITPRDGAEAMYGYVLKILCEHLGEHIGEDVACVRDHPYSSQLVSAGPPIPIPYDPGDFPEIGYLSVDDIPAEIQRINAAPKKAKVSLKLLLLSWMTKGLIGRQMNDEEVKEDMDAYRNTLEAARNKGLGVVSFRH